jgi:hypothetical protein
MGPKRADSKYLVELDQKRSRESRAHKRSSQKRKESNERLQRMADEAWRRFLEMRRTASVEALNERMEADKQMFGRLRTSQKSRELKARRRANDEREQKLRAEARMLMKM